MEAQLKLTGNELISEDTLKLFVFKGELLDTMTNKDYNNIFPFKHKDFQT